MDELAAKIESEIKNQGAISFARFMELALYCPVYGYYEKEADIIGRRGDYYTSVSVGKLFGQLLACQFSQWLDAEPAGGKRPLQLVEGGAHRGELARDILEWFQAIRPDLFENLEYRILEPSKLQRSLQEKTLSDLSLKVRWDESFAGLPAPRSHFRIIFSNELLDAFPVHRLGWDARSRAWFEWGVALGESGFEWVRMPSGPALSSTPGHDHPVSPSDTAFRLLRKQLDYLRSSAAEENAFDSERLLEVLPDGFTIEISPAVEQWWHAAAGAAIPGKLVTIDYGHTFEQFLRPENTHGTLRAYRRHQMVQDALASPGLQDITADVNFTLLELTGLSAGVCTEFFGSQTKFLTAIAGRIWESECAFAKWTTDCTRQFQTLTHPEHLGSRFQVLVQARRVAPAETAARS